MAKRQSKAKPTRGLKYDESSIKRLRGLEGIRAKPEMYLGERGDHMVFQGGKELIANCADEFFAGRNNYIFFHADNKSGTYIVADKAEGIPVGLVPEDPEKPKGKKVSTLTLIFSEIHTGGKFNDKAYSVSQGTHGVGASATNAVSDVFEVWTNRNKKWHYQKFCKGKPQGAVKEVRFPSDIKKVLPYNPTCGTIIRFKPDQSIVSRDGGKTQAKLDLGYTAQWMKDMAMLNPGLELVMSANGKVRSFLNKEGLIGIINGKIAKLELEATGKPFIYTSEHLAIAFRLTSYAEDDGVSTYVNSGITAQGGEHEVGFRNALSKALTTYKRKSEKYQPKDLYIGLLGVVNYKMSGAAFSNQTKERLTSNVSGPIEKELLPVLEVFFKKNKSLARAMIRRACDVNKSKEELKKTLKAVVDAKKKTKGSLPSSLVQAPSASPLTRELYIVEGDSAGGSAKKARDPRFQEVLKLTGKIYNAARTKPHKLMTSRPIVDILSSIGYNFDTQRKDSAEHKIRVARVILLPDSDVDGGHIAVLLLTLINKLMPELIEEGKVFLVDAPLFSAYYKGTRYFGATYEDVKKKLPKGAKCQIMRSKGWGEISAETLGLVAFDPETRGLLKVTPVKGDALKHFEALVGNDSLARKELLGL